MVRFNFVITKDLREKMHLLTYTWLRAKHHNIQKILLPYRFCGDSHHAFAFPFVLCILPFAP